MKKIDPIVLLSKAISLGPKGKAPMTVWPDGTNEVRIYVKEGFSGLVPKKFYLAQRIPFEPEGQVNYFIQGSTNEKLSQRYLKQMLERGKFSVAP